MHHACREALEQPHFMANWARRMQPQFQGRTNGDILREHNLESTLKEAKFTWEDLEPD
jgi:hypothetical protein